MTLQDKHWTIQQQNKCPPRTHLTGTRAGQVNTFAMNMNASTEGQLRSRRKAAKMLVAVVIMFAICFLPVHLLSVL
ncbi:hypothetical protein NQ317_002547, partial [Molorchus minor]